MHRYVLLNSVPLRARPGTTATSTRAQLARPSEGKPRAPSREATEVGGGRECPPPPPLLEFRAAPTAHGQRARMQRWRVACEGAARHRPLECWRAEDEPAAESRRAALRPPTTRAPSVPPRRCLARTSCRPVRQPARPSSSAPSSAPPAAASAPPPAWRR